MGNAMRFIRWFRRALDVAWISAIVTNKARRLEKKRQGIVTPDLYGWADRVDSLFAVFPNLTANSTVWTPEQGLELLSHIAVLLDEYTEAMDTHVVSTTV